MGGVTSAAPGKICIGALYCLERSAAQRSLSTQIPEDRGWLVVCATSDRDKSGLYVYCVTPASRDISLAMMGIADSRIYTLNHRDLSAMVHNCPAEPYQSNEPDIVGAWVMAHHKVVDAAWRLWGTVLPLNFNTIIPATEYDSRRNLNSWLEEEYMALREKLDALAGKAEYGVHVFYDPVALAMNVAASNVEGKRLTEDIEHKSPGLAYMRRQRLEGIVKKEMESRIENEYRNMYAQLISCVDGVRVEKPRKAPDGQRMLMNLSCLVSLDERLRLLSALEEIGSLEGFTTRLVGPMPPYSFC